MAGQDPAFSDHHDHFSRHQRPTFLKPWWYYFKTIVYDFFPLSLLLPVSIGFAVPRWRDAAVRLPLIWLLYTFLFFCLSGSKQGKYLLPMTPAIIAIGLLGLQQAEQRFRLSLWPLFKRWSVLLVMVFAVVILAILPNYSDELGGVGGYRPIVTALTRQPATLVHYGRPRALTLYELGAPMPCVNSARELYSKIGSGDITPGTYVLVYQHDLEELGGAHLLAQPEPFLNFFEIVLETNLAKPATLLRVRLDAPNLPTPDTPEPEPMFWRDRYFDTD